MLLNLYITNGEVVRLHQEVQLRSGSMYAITVAPVVIFVVFQAVLAQSWDFTALVLSVVILGKYVVNVDAL